MGPLTDEERVALGEHLKACKAGQKKFLSDLSTKLGDDMRHDRQVAELVWGAMANVLWVHASGALAQFSFREAGAEIAEIVGDGGDYMDWYCSSPNGVVPAFIGDALASDGWTAHQPLERMPWIGTRVTPSSQGRKNETGAKSLTAVPNSPETDGAEKPLSP